MIVYIVTLNWLRPIENHLHTTEEQYTTPTIPNLPTIPGTPAAPTSDEPYYIYDGDISLNDGTLSESTLLCRGERACEGIYDKYLNLLSQKLGIPSEVMRFDDKVNYGSVATVWMFKGGYELCLISDNYSHYWRSRGKHPEIRLMLINIEKSYRKEYGFD